MPTLFHFIVSVFVVLFWSILGLFCYLGLSDSKRTDNWTNYQLAITIFLLGPIVWLIEFVCFAYGLGHSANEDDDSHICCGAPQHITGLVVT